MSDQDVSVFVQGLIPTPGGAGLLLGNDDKTIILFIDEFVATVLEMAMKGETPGRPLTHHLLSSVLLGTGTHLRKVVVHDYSDEVYYARIHLEQQNEIGQSLVEVDARPSDSVVIAVLNKAPIYIRPGVWDAAEDVRPTLDQD